MGTTLPYLSYTKRSKVTGKNKWALKKIQCYACRGTFSTHDPTKMYCSAACRKVEEHRRRRAKLKADDQRKAEIIERTKKEIGYA